MAKVAIVTDSNSGITQKQAQEMGIYVLPMPFMIDEGTFFEDISLTQAEFYEKMAAGANVVTSQPSPENVMQLWDGILKEYDEIVHIPMSSGLSGSCYNAVMLSDAERFRGRVQVVDNLRISVVQRQSVLDAMGMIAKGRDAAAIKASLEADKYNCSIYIMLDTLYYLKKGGRITPAAAMLGSVLRIKPVLQIQGDKLDAFAKARTVKQGKTLMINAIRNDLSSRFGGADAAHVRLQIAHSENAAEALRLREELSALFPEVVKGGERIYIDRLSLSVACHIGPGALAIACTQNIVD